MPLDNETRKLAKDLLLFMKDKYGFDQMPHVKFVFDKQNAENPLGYTGHYADQTGDIVIYCEGRHPKDILRSLAHETLHHVQNFEGAFKDKDMSDTSDPNYLVKNDFLKGIEADAFERGNVTFREWEASKKEDTGMKKLNEVSDATIVAAHKQGKKLVKHGMSKDKAYAIAMNQAKRGEVEEEKMENDKKEVKEVEVNEMISNSHTYVPEDRAMAEAYQTRDEKVYEQLLKKFGIKK